ncbi:alpha/beta fold hydrolase [Micromonospora sp. CPCC 205561]|uniref:alpha/beta fold hydrolase n=1 Tax=Micromonospora sp. CPCC 205561 TaxID=3122407 RepID=UPI002FEFC44E
MSPVAVRPSLVTLHEPAHADTTGTAVLVHGTLDRAANFRTVARHLPDWRVVGWDRRGWATSRELGDEHTTLRHHVEDLCEILTRAPGAVVAGHSYGGLVALCAAAQRPDLPAAVVAFEPPVRWLPWWRPETEPDSTGDDDASGAVEKVLRHILGEAGWVRLSRESRARLQAEGPALLVEMGDPSQDEVAFDPAELSVPVVIAAGTRSLPAHREVAHRLAALVPHGEFTTIAGAGHAAHVSHAREFARLVERAAALAGAEERDR